MKGMKRLWVGILGLPLASCTGRGVATPDAMAGSGGNFSTTTAHTEPCNDGMVWVPFPPNSRHMFIMGSDDGYPEEAPAREVPVVEASSPLREKGFWIDATEVTNRQFAAFVAATDYITLAERQPKAEDYPDADAAFLVPGSAVFVPPAADGPLAELSWWRYILGACWKHPEGPGSSIDARMDHPVVHVAFEDATAYAAWAGKRLPTEIEWEYAARGGLVGKTYAWGDEFTPGGKHMANTWQGAFPRGNTADDGFTGTAPVGQFPPNGFGLFDMAGNVWEWTTTKAVPAHTGERITKGGSFLCAPNYCSRYRPAAKSPVTADTSTSHVGFRCVQLTSSPP